MILKDFNKLETGSLVTYHGKTYIILFSGYMRHSGDNETIRSLLYWCKKYHLPDKYVRTIYVNGYNIEDMTDIKRLNLYSKDVRLSKKQLSPKEKELYLLKFQLNGINVTNLDRAELQQGKYYVLRVQLPELGEKYAKVFSSKDLLSYNILTTYLIKRENDSFIIYNSILKQSTYYYYKETVIKATNNKYTSLLNILSYPFYKDLWYSVYADRVKKVKLKVTQEKELFDLNIVYENFKNKIQEVRLNKDSAKENYVDYLKLVYYKKHNMLLSMFVSTNIDLGNVNFDFMDENGNQILRHTEYNFTEKSDVIDYLCPFVERIMSLLPDTKYEEYSDIVLHEYYEDVNANVLYLPFVTVDTSNKRIIANTKVNNYTNLKEELVKLYDIRYLNLYSYFLDLNNFRS